MLKTGKQNYAVVKSATLSSPYDPRYIVVDAETGKTLDDANGYGYKSAQKAHAAFGYKRKPHAQRKAEEKAKAAVHKWLQDHLDFKEDVEEAVIQAAKTSPYGSNVKLGTNFLNECLKEAGITDLPFSVKDLHRYWFS